MFTPRRFAIAAIGFAAGAAIFALFIIVSTGAKAQTPPPYVAACDLNNDGVVSPADLAILRTRFGWAVTPGSLGDPNGDGIINIADYRFCQLHQTATAP